MGTQRGEVRLLWPDGRYWVHQLAWDVRPLVDATPRGLVLRSAGANHEYDVVIRSQDRPIRIIGVEGIALRSPAGPFDPIPRPSQPLRLALDPTRTAAKASDILITTDHPKQPRVVLSVVATPNASEERP